MIEDIFNREILLIGQEKFNLIKNSHAAVFGLGGVGSYAAESLVRSGIGEITIFDCDKSELSNINRQLFALHSETGKMKTETAFKRFKQINPECKINIVNEFLSPENIESHITEFQYAIDAIDTIESKIFLIKTLIKKNITFISSMGSAGKLDPEKIKISDIRKTSVCPLAKIIRKEIRNSQIKQKIPVVYSTEEKVQIEQNGNIVLNNTTRKRPLGTSSFIPPIFGFYCASHIIRKIIET